MRRIKYRIKPKQKKKKKKESVVQGNKKKKKDWVGKKERKNGSRVIKSRLWWKYI